MVTVLPSAEGGRYPYGNSVLVRGASEKVLIDPSLSVADASTSSIEPLDVDRVLISHCHEDHLAGLFRLPHAAVHVHESDHIGLTSLDGLMQIYGMPPETETSWRQEVLERFHYVPRPDAVSFRDDDTFDLGAVRIRVIHLPGHTRGHSGFFVEPDDVMFLADIDLTGFGPYYGDAWSSIDDFETSLARCREIEAVSYVTFHHKGTVHSRRDLLQLLDQYRAVIDRREQAMLEFLRDPRTLDDMVAHRFVYRPHVQLLFADAVERRAAQLHIERLMTRGLVTSIAPGQFVAVR
jgi:glyoxylase-like metal-dependent hydrolase (beta-lactamase superfamily II)